MKTVATDEIDQPFDLIIMACKAYQLDAAMDAIAPAVGDNTAVLPLLNGMKQIDVLQARFGADKVLGGTTYIGARVDAETGDIVHFGDFHRIAYGEVDGHIRSAQRVEAFAALERVHEVRHRSAVTTSMQAMWDKFAMLCAMSSVNTIARATVGEILATPVRARVPDRGTGRVPGYGRRAGAHGVGHGGDRDL